MVALLLLYPTLSAVRLVGTDLVQAVPLVLSAAISHVLVSGVEWAVLIPLILGGSPGTFLGARLANWVSQSVIRRGIVIVLSLTGLNMLGVPPEIVGIIGAGLLLLGPLAWGFIRQCARPAGLRQQRRRLATGRRCGRTRRGRIERRGADRPRWSEATSTGSMEPGQRRKRRDVGQRLVVRRQQPGLLGLGERRRLRVLVGQQRLERPPVAAGASASRCRARGRAGARRARGRARRAPSRGTGSRCGPRAP